jgi:heme exporter protein D
MGGWQAFPILVWLVFVLSVIGLLLAMYGPIGEVDKHN